jgi:hypothetical protein
MDAGLFCVSDDMKRRYRCRESAEKKEQGRSPARKIVSTLLPQTLDFILA